MTRYLVRGRGRGGAGARAGAKADADADAKAEAKANPEPDLTRPHGAGVPERGVGLFYAAAAVGEEERHNEAWRGRGGAWGERMKASSREGRVLHLGRLALGAGVHLGSASGKCRCAACVCRPQTKGGEPLCAGRFGWDWKRLGLRGGGWRRARGHWRMALVVVLGEGGTARKGRLHLGPQGCTRR